VLFDDPTPKQWVGIVVDWAAVDRVPE